MRLRAAERRPGFAHWATPWQEEHSNGEPQKPLKGAIDA